MAFGFNILTAAGPEGVERMGAGAAAMRDLQKEGQRILKGCPEFAMRWAFRRFGHLRHKACREIRALVVGAVGVILELSLSTLLASVANVSSGVGGNTAATACAVSALSADIEADASFFGNGSVKSSNHVN